MEKLKQRYGKHLCAHLHSDVLKVAPNQSLTPQQIVERYTRGLLGNIEKTPVEPLVEEGADDLQVSTAFEKGIPYSMKLDILDYYAYSKAQKERAAALRKQIADIGAASRKAAEPPTPPPSE